MAAVMTSESGDEEKIYAAVEECKKMGIAVLPPDVTESFGDFTVIDDHTIRFGLGGIKNLGSDVVNKVIECHVAKTKFTTLEDFLISCYTKNLNKKSWEALVKAGALDRFGERGQLLASTENVLDFLRDHFKKENPGQNSLFGASLQVGKLKLKTGVVEATTEEKLGWEKEHLGLFVSAHPLDRYSGVLDTMTKISNVAALTDGTMVNIAGLIAKYKRTLTKKNDPMAFFTLQDLTGSTEVLVFPKVMLKALPYLDLDRIVQVSGRISDKDGERKIIAEEVKDIVSDELYDIALSEMEKHQQIVIHMQSIQNTDALNQIKELLTANPGNAQVYLSVGLNGAGKTIKTQSQVRISQDLLKNLKRIPDIVTITDSISDS
jgi:DNA polymerase III subunit alpha